MKRLVGLLAVLSLVLFMTGAGMAMGTKPGAQPANVPNEPSPTQEYGAGGPGGDYGANTTGSSTTASGGISGEPLTLPSGITGGRTSPSGTASSAGATGNTTSGAMAGGTTSGGAAGAGPSSAGGTSTGTK